MDVGTILITDGMERSALAAARALVSAGHTVYVAAAARFSLAGVSRRVRPLMITQDPRAGGDGYAAELARNVRGLGIDVLLPMTDASVEAVLVSRNLFPNAVAIPLPDLATYRLASDKLAVLELARAAGFDVPETEVVPCSGGSETWAERVRFPAVVKPHRSMMGAGVAFVSDVAACRRALAALPPEAFPVLLQRRVRGSGEGLFALRWDGRLRAVFAHRRLREKPPAGGVSVYRESIEPPAGLVRAGERLLEALDWRGVAMIECKRDAVTQRHVIMEVNGRFWGSLQLAIDAGVDFPALLVACALDQARPESGRPTYRIGVRSRWFWGDVDHLYLRLRRSAAQLHLEDGAGSRLRALLRFLSFRPSRDHAEVWRWRDPAPFFLETLQRFGLATR